jgi:hypothetical protein
LNKLRYRIILGYPSKEIKSVCLGFDKAYLLTNNRSVMELDASADALMSY